MRRYRILSFDFDSRASSLNIAEEHWEDNVKEQHEIARASAIARLSSQFGDSKIESKVNNFIELGNKPFSILAFHNKFLAQIRNSYVIGSYYPALTGACALGERLLNHLVLLLREYHRGTEAYRKVYKKDSFDNWPVAIDALDSWNELLPEAVEKFRILNKKRNRAIHFNPETDHNDKAHALEAIHLIQEIVHIQFSAFGTQPWFFCVPGEIYIKKEWESKPLIKHLFIPNALLVGPEHRVVQIIPQVLVNDKEIYDNREISDEEYSNLRVGANKSSHSQP